jgi:hypothetical protein
MGRPRTRTDYLDLDTIAQMKRYMATATEGARMLGVDVGVLRRALSWNYLTPEERQEVEAAWARLNPTDVLSTATSLRKKLEDTPKEDIPADIRNEALYVARKVERLVNALYIESKD